MAIRIASRTSIGASWETVWQHNSQIIRVSAHVGCADNTGKDIRIGNGVKNWRETDFFNVSNDVNRLGTIRARIANEIGVGELIANLENYCPGILIYTDLKIVICSLFTIAVQRILS